MLLLLLLALLTLPQDARPDTSRFVANGKNTYFMLEPGYQLTLRGREDGRNVELTVKVLDATQVVDGVTTRVVEERESENGRLIEISRNFFAFDPATSNVYYFGEDVDIYKDGRVTGHEGAWRAGERGARFGLMMPGSPVVGMKHYQEQAEGVAMDHAEVVSLTDTLKTPAGTFQRCLKTKETTPLEKGAVEFKVYAPGVGLVKDGNLLLASYGFAR